jgi:hypothetical protein
MRVVRTKIMGHPESSSDWTLFNPKLRFVAKGQCNLLKNIGLKIHLKTELLVSRKLKQTLHPEKRHMEISALDGDISSPSRDSGEGFSSEDVFF